MHFDIEIVFILFSWWIYGRRAKLVTYDTLLFILLSSQLQTNLSRKFQENEGEEKRITEKNVNSHSWCKKFRKRKYEKKIIKQINTKDDIKVQINFGKNTPIKQK